MPLFEFGCKSCGYEFEELTSKSVDTFPCKKCGKDSEKKMSRFAAVVVGSPNELYDVKIGRAANKRWEMHHERQDARRSGKKLEVLDVPKIGKKFAPAMALGNKEQREKRVEYSSALQSHRKKRQTRGQKQFSDSGSF